LYVFTKAIYNVLIHPLSSFPGPQSYAASIIPYVCSLLRGRLCFDIEEFHQKYGDVVRIGPNELSYSNPSAWNEIYGHRHGKENMPKEEIIYSPPLYGPKSIITADDRMHTRYRRLLSHAFSDKALRDQESIMAKFVDLLIQRLYENANNGSSMVDMTAWYNFTTFDMIGELAFGESFHCLEMSSYHPWVRMMFAGVKANSYFNAIKRFPALEKFLTYFMPASVMAAKKAHTDLVIERVKQRLITKTDKADFTTFILRNQDKDPLTEKELQANADILILAGSETSATLLSGVSYYLCKNPIIMQKLCDEIRGAFKSEDEINITTCNGLKYMLAVLEEGLRMYPPAPSGFPRIVPRGGEIISGKFVPEGVSVPPELFH
jgi:cytochrome P450